MSETKNTPPIAPVDEGVIAAMRRASAMTLPDDPSASGMKAGGIRRRFWESIFGRVSLLSELQRVIGEANARLLEVDGRSVYEYALEIGFEGTEAAFNEVFVKALRGEGEMIEKLGDRLSALEQRLESLPDTPTVSAPLYGGEVEVV